jgi:histidinol phosphatase-like PHP family hydrolase
MIIASFHNVYQEKRIWMNALAKTIENPYVNVIGHLAPETAFTLNRSEVESIAAKIVENEKIVEINAKYHRPPGDWILIFRDKGVRFHLGSDAHSLSEIGQFARVSDLISLAENC